MNEQPIGDGLRELAELAGPHQVDLHHIGDRIRRRRRTRRALASGVAVALVVAGGWLLPGLVSGGAGSSVVPAAPPSPVAPLPSGGAQGSLPLPTPQKLDPEAQQVAAIFRHVLASAVSGKLTVLAGVGLHDKGSATPLGSGLFEPGVSGLYDDGHGVSAVWADLSRWSKPDTTVFPYACKAQPGVPFGSKCQVVHLTGGGVVGIEQMPAEGNSSALWTATYAAPDGARVVIQEENAPGDKGYTPTRAEPPFDAAQLQRMVTSPLWNPQLDAIPRSGGQSNNVDTPFGPDGIGAIFYRLIPSGFAISGAKGAENPMMGNTMVLTDAQGKGSVYGWESIGGPTVQQGYPNATRLSDGSWLGSKQVPGQGGGGTEQYWVAVQRGNTEIVVVALNSVGLDGPRSRATPVLTIDQLTAIAESPTWGSGT
ncbi:hypothetical protein [Streptacidiphilus jiangxiensis]|uniref:Uncharacterized protein n=1 Tax=Streptacidiphilus jiangxiensis TaxID=235985 RepID=A0A1H7Q4I9_STRJI|nr:hypothetical protein [Streptacidiphilus jiangxiensis]SEL43061.1 hypothetical protein SAMN05414137_108293 [Streptacidiphilus jiangxiensis]